MRNRAGELSCLFENTNAVCKLDTSHFDLSGFPKTTCHFLWKAYIYLISDKGKTFDEKAATWCWLSLPAAPRSPEGMKTWGTCHSRSYRIAGEGLKFLVKHHFTSSLHDISCPPYRPAAAGVPGFLHGTPIASHIHAGARRAKQRGG